MSTNSICRLEKRVRDALFFAVHKFKFQPSDPKRIKVLLFVACNLRSYDVDHQKVRLRTQFDFENNECYLQVVCKDSDCLKETIIDTEGFCYPRGAIFFDDSFVAKSVNLADFAHMYFATDKLYEIFKEVQQQGIRQMDL